MSDSSLSDVPDDAFTERLDRRPTKRIKLTYRKSSQHKPCSARALNKDVGHTVSGRPVAKTNAASSQASDRHVIQPQPNLPPPTDPVTTPRFSPNKMTLLPTVELQHLRQNNAFLRRSNIELAMSHASAINERDEASESARKSQEEVFKMKREVAVMTAAEEGKLDVARRLIQLEEYRRVYWECGVEWARREGEWGWERDLLRREVAGLLERVGELEGRSEASAFDPMQMGNQIGHQGGGQMSAQQESIGEGNAQGLEPDWEMLMQEQFGEQQQQGEFEALMMPEDEPQTCTEPMGMHMSLPLSWDTPAPMMTPQELGLGDFGVDNWMNAEQTMDTTEGFGNGYSRNADPSSGAR